MGFSEILQRKIDAYLVTYGITADHNTHRLFDKNDKHQGMYEIEEGYSNPNDNSLTINFEMNQNLTIPTLKVNYLEFD